ncbi:MAG: DUF2088 domain-containing protein [Candidatus Eisenbacteria bacterium]|nr:DUF2088 domain-containing protein [Candidatus Eisenbacteria bacterium]
MAWKLKYGDTGVTFAAPEGVTVSLLAPAPITPLLDPTQAVRDALDAPTGSPRLRDLAAGARKVLLVVPALSRPCGLPVVLSQVLDVLQDSGVGLRQVEILVARGLQPRLEADQVEAVIGSEVWNRVVVDQHDADDAEGLDELGDTERGTPLHLNRRTMEAGQLLVLVGTLGLDPLAGFSGGPGLMLPGLSGRATALASRRLALGDPSGSEPAPDCRPGELEGNPLYEDSVEATEKVDPDFLVHTAVDEDGRMLKVVAGEWRKAYEAGCNWLRPRLRTPFAEPRPWAVASAGGRDRDFLLSLAPLVSASACVRDGGSLVYLARCGGGLGSASLEKWLTLGSAAAISGALRGEYDADGHLAMLVRRELERIQVHLVSSLPSDTVKKLGLIPHATLEEAVEAARAAAPEGSQGFVVPAPARTLLGSVSASAREAVAG